MKPSLMAKQVETTLRNTTRAFPIFRETISLTPPAQGGGSSPLHIDSRMSISLQRSRERSSRHTSGNRERTTALVQFPTYLASATLRAPSRDQDRGTHKSLK
jgi:hypothetical protein